MTNKQPCCNKCSCWEKDPYCCHNNDCDCHTPASKQTGGKIQCSDFSCSEGCTGVHVGAHCLVPSDIRGAICSLTSRMLDNPDKSGIYQTTRFYDDMESFIKSLLSSERKTLAEKVAKIRNKFRKFDNYDGNNLHSAEEHYSISAKNWDEIIRLEDGAQAALSEVLALLK